MKIGLGQAGKREACTALSVAEFFEVQVERKRVKKNLMFQLKEYRKVICSNTSFYLGQK